MLKSIEENIIKTLHLDTLPEAQQKKIFEDMGHIIYQRILIRVLETLDEAGKDEFDKILGKKGVTGDEVLVFLRNKIANLDQIMNEEILSLKERAVSVMENAAK